MEEILHPSHYNQGSVECIEATKSAIANISDPFEAYCTGNIIKYIWRWNDKNGIEDLHKAMQYIDFIEQYRAAKTDMVIPTTDKPKADKYASMTDGKVEKLEQINYADMSDGELMMKICHGRCCADCPLCKTNNGYDIECYDLKLRNPEEFRKVATEWLEAHDKKEGEK